MKRKAYGRNRFPVLWNRCVRGDYYCMGIACGDAYSQAVPGQFVMLKTGSGLTPLLRRPFSIHRIVTENGKLCGLEILYKVIGKGTRLLSRMPTGHPLEMIGPLGRGFEIPSGAERIYIVAGGVGIAPLLFLASELRNSAGNDLDCSVFLGGRTADDILCRSLFEQYAITVRPATEDGTMGHRGLVTDLLTEALGKDLPDTIYACGPTGMLRSVSRLAARFGVRCQVSIETMMACGMGACMGCAVEKAGKSDRYLHACLDGPVFDSMKIEW